LSRRSGQAGNSGIIEQAPALADSTRKFRGDE
jgi:hypothetical protein